MKHWLRFVFAFSSIVFGSSPIFAQSQPVLTVSITSPVNEASGPSGTTLAISALARGTFPPAGFIYTFFVNGISISPGIPAAAGTPASVSWAPPQPGAYFLTVTATDGLNSATSLPVRYFATGTQIVNPVAGSSTIVPVGSSLVLKGDATPAGGFIQRIDFYADDVLIGSDTTAPYSLIYTPPATPATHRVDVRAFDNNGAQVSPRRAAGTFADLTMVTPVGQAPTSSISSPINGSAIAIPNYVLSPSASIPVAVSANDADGILSKVELYIDGVLFATGTSFPYTFNWQPPVIGTFKLVALAYDDKNNVTASSTNTIIISAPPTVAITAPTANATVAGGVPTQIQANASDSDGSVVKVQFFAGTVFIGEVSAPPYIIGWTPAPPTVSATGVVIGGSAALTALAYDNVGLTTRSSAVTVTITGAGGSGGSAVVGQPPVVAITAPVASTQLVVGSPVTLSANASDPDGNIFSVQFYVNNVNVGTDTTYPYSVIWTPVSNGTYNIIAKATDNDGNTVTSSVVNVTVADPSAGIPVVTLTSPANGASFTVGAAQIISATATDDGAVAGVQFYVNGQPLGPLVTAFPYRTTWTPVSPGNYTITARATDNSGNQGTASPVTVTVSGGTAPTIAMTNPTSGSIVALGSGVQVVANASDIDGKVTQVQFFANGISIGVTSSAPYVANWVPTTAGAYNLTATATDNTGNTTTTPAVAVTVVAASAPGVTISNPVSGSSFVVGTSIPVNAITTGGNGAITQVQFFVNGASIGIDAIAPYAATWVPVAAGTYTLFAVVTDSAGISSTSSVSTVTIKANSPPSVSFISPGSDLTVALGTSINLSATASDSDGTITNVRFLASGTVVGSVSAPPYSVVFSPSAAGVYSIVAQAQDNAGNTTDSTPLTITVLGGNVPVVTLTNPSGDASISADSSLLLGAFAAISTGSISRVEFYAGNTLLTTLSAPPFTYVWRPASTGVFPVRVVAYSGSGPGVSSSVSTVTVSSAVVAPGLRTIALTNPTDGQTIVAFRNITFSAATNIADTLNPQIDFYSNGSLIQTVTARPYQITRNPTIPGRYEFYAVVRVNGSTYTSAPVAITVLPNLPPSVSISAPTSGSTVIVGNTVTLRALATDPDDAIDTVQFLVNGQPLSTSTNFPYTASWQPGAEGVYTISAIVKDSRGSVGGNETTSAAIYVRAVAPAGSGGAAPDVVYGGSYFSAAESGKFAAVTLNGRDAIFIGYSTSGAPKTYFYAGLPVDAGGGFAKADSSGRVLVNGVSSESGVSGNLDGNRLTFIGPITFAAGSTTAPSGYYAGNLSGKLDSTVAAIVGLDSSITVFVSNGSFADAGSGRLATGGAFSLTTASGLLLAGKIDAATGLFTGTLSGSNGGAFTGALASGGSFSDGALRNLSTRGQVGTGANVLIAGFVVGGTAPKQVLVRAIGPSLSQFGITGALADPQLSIFQGGNTIASNDNWGGSAPLVSAAAQAGAFALDATSKDAVVLTTLNPGAYTAQVSGVGGTTGVALVELYDRDASSPFSPQKVLNVATRGVVSSGQGALIAGFVVNGTVSKKLLIRAVGPGLAAFGVTGALADPILRVIRNDNVVVRENDNWETGNDSLLIADASSKSGAFALVPGSRDAALLFSLPPGTYTAQVSGANNSGGVALIEVYEVP